MDTLEYRTVDKSEWGDGPWQSEPDKKQWQDPATGLPCLIVRNNGGALCGYVGLSEGHPLYGNGYETPEVDVHWGLTFAGPCAEVTAESWARAQERFVRAELEARRLPVGDAAKFRKTVAPVIDDFEAWAEHTKQRTICHIPALGDPDHVWWFGFDCAHSGDVSPAYAVYSSRFNSAEDRYRDIRFVERECAKLAQQLASAIDSREAGETHLAARSEGPERDGASRDAPEQSS